MASNSRRVGVFGGNFDPFHTGHLESMLQVGERLSLDEVRVVPAAVSPLRLQTQGSSPDQRLEMLRLGVAGHEPVIRVDTCELARGGVSYTVDTLEAYSREFADSRLFLIVGMDQFAKFDQWKDYERILALADLVVTTRPGLDLPRSSDEYPPGLRALVADHDLHQALLKTGKAIHFIQLKPTDASGTEIRRKVRLGQNVGALVPPSVEAYILEHQLYRSVQRQIGDFEKFAAYCARALADKGGINVRTFDIRDRAAPSEFTVIASGTSTRHATALAEHLVRDVKRDFDVWPENIEGQTEGRWVVVDYGALIAHVFYDFVRQEYRLEDLWSKPS